MTSIIKVDNLQNQCGANIINENAGTITIGASGDTVTLAAGASQSGFGRSGSVNWDTTPKTTSPVTAVSGNGYFIDTTSGAITINLPSTPSAGDIVAIADYANTAATSNITVGRNSSNIDGEAVDAKIKINGQVYTLVYVDATEGWKTVGQTVNQITTKEFVAATGGCIATCGDYKIHTFTGPGTFTVTNAGNPIGSNSVDYLVVGGGGSGGTSCSPRSGGGGAGGYRFSNGTASGCYSAGPAPLGDSALPVSVQGYPIIIGGGGAAVPTSNIQGNQGTSSIFSTITSTGGGGGGGQANVVGPIANGGPGGSGGGSTGFGGANPGGGTIGSGNTPPVSPPQGNNGGQGNHAPGFWAAGGGGGGAGAVGGNASPVPTPTPAASTGAGGAGLASSITASSVTRGGGGGGVGVNIPPGAGGSGGGGAGISCGTGGSGTPNSGGGGGAGTASGAGGSGIVVIRYKFQ
jgi:hypothetical protein